jgi:hypothetical protein
MALTLLVLALGAALVVVVVLVAAFARGSRGVAPAELHTVGLLLDRAIGGYRRSLVPLLLLSTLLLPLGTVGGLNGFALLLVLGAAPTSANGEPLGGLAGLTVLLGLAGALGIGRTLLACGAAQLLAARAQGGGGGLADALPLGRAGHLLGLTALLVPLALIASFLGIFGALATPLWVLAPAALIVEGLGPVGAIQRGFRLARRNYLALVGTLLPLALIGWLVAATPLFGGVALLGWARLLPDDLVGPLLLGCWLLSGLFVAPLLAVGAYVCYRQFHADELLELPPPFLPY